jgi:LysM repeat protein
MKANRSILIAFFILFTFESYAQENYQYKKIDGKEYILYSVQSGEGLYGIGRKFNIAVKDLNTLNPDAANGLKTGQIVLIPVTKDSKKAIANSEKPTAQNSVNQNTNKSDYTEHIVAKRQTLFAISRKYDISQEELKKHNPELENGLKIGMVLRIPKIATEESNEQKKKENVEKIEDEGSKAKKNKKEPKTVLIKHIVKQKETLYAISKLYNVDVEDIIKLNPTALASLIIGSELIIEVKKEVAAALEKSDIKPVEPEVIKPQQTTTVDLQYLTRLTKNVKPNNSPIKIAILLPLVIENAKADAVNERFQEFYAGLLLAANEAKRKGVSIDILTFDTEKTEEKMVEVLQNRELKSVDLIIGPAYSNQISYLSDFAKANKINAIIPFSSKVSDLSDNPYLLQFNPSRNIETDYLTNLLTQQYKNDNIVFIDLPNISDNDAGFECALNLKILLKNKNRKFSVIDSIPNQSLQTTTAFDKEKANIVIFNTDKFSSIYPYLSFLNANALNYNILLYEQYSWKNQNAQVKFKSFSIAPFKPLLNDVDFTNYSTLFKSFFNWRISSTNPRYDVLGYDLGNYAIAMIYEFGPQFGWGKTKLPLASGIQSFLKFERSTPSGGFVNTQLYQHEK